MKTKSIFTAIMLIALTSTTIFAQRKTDIKGAKDYPLVSRFEGSIIQYYKATKWDTYKLPVFKDNTKEPNYKTPLILEGKIMRWQYSVAPDNNPSYIMKNYETAFKKNGYKILLEGKPGEDFEEGPASFQGDYYGNLKLDKFGFAYNPIGNHKAIIIAKTTNDGKDIYIVEVISDFTNTTFITQDIIEVEAAETGKVTAKNISKGITSKGHIAIYDIHFDTAKSEIKPESTEAIKNIAEYLNNNPDIKILIVGHTDNVGDFDANIKLSLERAKAVKDVLVNNYGIEVNRLKAYGDGSTAPVASNATDTGKAKNRRVEIVEQ
ncbi:OmpA family protein [Lutibacter sp.]|uniref:OmpA family protein n=1 Tax=Lutibacter sp. TaxID=1925666 RepID=UPI0025C35266|nr:OmpA family protein [Lutibacter sp.]MCF6182303.1 OmpA family protein [Lutibacter sp.]